MSFVRKSLLTISGKFFPPEGFSGPWGDPGYCNGYTGPTAPAFPTGAWYYGPSGPTGPQPAAVTCVVSYQPPNKTPSWTSWAGPTGPTCPPPLVATVPLGLQVDGQTWLGTWDSSVAEGRVDWVVYSAGQTVAAAQGTITVQANSANVQVP